MRKLTTARVLLVGFLTLWTTFLLTVNAHAQPETLVNVGSSGHSVLPPSFNGAIQWAQYMSGGGAIMTGGGAAAGSSAVGAIAAPAGGAIAGGLVGANCYNKLRESTVGEISDADAALCVPRMAWRGIEGLWTRWVDPDPDPPAGALQAWSWYAGGVTESHDQNTSCHEPPNGDRCVIEHLDMTEYGHPVDHYEFCSSNCYWHITPIGGGTWAAATRLDAGSSTGTKQYVWTSKITLSGTGAWAIDYLEVWAGTSTSRKTHVANITLGGTGEVTRTVEAEADCIDTITGAITTVREAVAYTTSDLDAQGRAEVQIPEIECPAGTRVDGVTITRTGPDLPDRTIGVGDVPEQLDDPNHPQADCLSGRVVCSVMLYRVEGTRLVDCNTHGGLCADWTKDPDRETIYQCRYGEYTPGADGATMPHVLPLSDCFYLERAHPEGTLTQTHDGDPDGDGDPENKAVPPPVSDSNPFKAALRWAFEPRGTESRIDGIMDKMTDKAPVAQFESIAGWLRQIEVALDPTQACWQIEPEILDYGEYTVLDSCDPSHQVSGILLGYRGTMAVVMYGIFVIPLAWWAWKAYAPGTSVENG